MPITNEELKEPDDRLREMQQPLSYNHDLGMMHRSQIHKDELQPSSNIIAKTSHKEETGRNITDNGSPRLRNEGERQESFLRNAILKDEERRQMQMETTYNRKRGSERPENTNTYSGSFTDSDTESRALKFRSFVEHSNEIEDDIKGESQNEDDEKDDDDSEEKDSDDEKDDANGSSPSFKKRNTFRVKPDPKYNGKNDFGKSLIVRVFPLFPNIIFYSLRNNNIT